MFWGGGFNDYAGYMKSADSHFSFELKHGLNVKVIWGPLSLIKMTFIKCIYKTSGTYVKLRSRASFGIMGLGAPSFSQ